MIYLCCAQCSFASYIVYCYCCCSIIHSSFVHLLFNFCLVNYFVLFNNHCSLFVGKIFNSNPGLYSRYFDPIVPDTKSINIIHQTAPSLSQYRSKWPITIIDIEGYTEPISSKTKLAEDKTIKLLFLKPDLFLTKCLRNISCQRVLSNISHFR